MDQLRPLLVPVFEQARTWDDLDHAIAAHGLTLARKGQGFVIADATGEMKLSDLGAGIRMAALRQRLGKMPEEGSELRGGGLSQTAEGPARRRRRERGR